MLLLDGNKISIDEKFLDNQTKLSDAFNAIEKQLSK